MDTPLIKPTSGCVFPGQSVSWCASRAFGAVTLAGWLLSGSLVLSGCSFFGDEASGGASGVAVQSGGGQSAGQSGGQSADRVQMSGEYRVGPDGKLVSPVDPLSVPVPVLGAEAQFETPEGMEAFAKYVIELIPYTWMTGNTTKLEAISLPECQWCDRVIDLTKKRHQAGGWVDRVEIGIKSSRFPFEIPEHDGLWHTELVIERSSTVMYDGSKTEKLSGKEEQLVLQARYIDGHWKMTGAGAATDEN